MPDRTRPRRRGRRRRPLAPADRDVLRRRYEAAEETVAALAAAFGLSRDAVAGLARRNGWVRPPRTAVRKPARSSTGALSNAAPPDAGAAPEVAATDAAVASADPPPPRAPRRPAARRAARPLAERLERAVAREIAAIERARRATSRKPAAAADTERTVRSLERLTDTLAKVRRLRDPAAASDPDDDLPRDIDEFRRVLARRIEELVRSRSDDGSDDGAAADGAAAAG
ncbi:hypothetical protein RHODGE_RHODGE_00437 [Rhodoplanes serenus]|uniref:Uncharacterized protein n=1 Tax=Rhodoplanes serenus TaxID=200615 RepID=A0A447CQ77_9BRAD|nr:hypothetical protein [Rhodoplanes serenus]VCU07334.1 hypothetical protein RHODGE_RHODGE_00437 [Rhodoplanes serenus]